MISRIELIEGDVAQIGLGLSDEDRELIANNVTLIYHAAATIRFDEMIKKAVELNTRGTQEMIKLALECKKLEVSLRQPKSETGHVLRDDDEIISVASLSGVLLCLHRLRLSQRNVFDGEALRSASRSPKAHKIRRTFERGRARENERRYFRKFPQQLFIHESNG